MTTPSPEQIVTNAAAFIKVYDAVEYSFDNGVSQELATMTLSELRQSLQGDVPSEISREIGRAFAVRVERLAQVEALSASAGNTSTSTEKLIALEEGYFDAMGKELETAVNMRTNALRRLLPSYAVERTDFLKSLRMDLTETEKVYAELGLDLTSLEFDYNLGRFDQASVQRLNEKFLETQTSVQGSGMHMELFSIYERQTMVALHADAQAYSVYAMFSADPEFSEFSGRHEDLMTREDLARVDEICNEIANGLQARLTGFAAAVEELLTQEQSRSSDGSSFGRDIGL